ncbi:isocitrate lyase/PEP mutase family protein [Lysobacter niastensis]|uniref:Isocitrate lyase/phosphoenolpyruvate mutase family protein n=1 Tax=Lysobacter niastensis TaxID=380629 RepID=A0ABS0B6X3_9GAMM|nr:isocitrate lyase/phosphoenolpyruvate mutase family protein [Lysobacter niastensis]MBF6024755.1 isocitrate lyase/phosphoenolpyruvate mutase family protein [Lysobacter niastensis]
MDTASGFESFRRLHQDGILLLANAWDAGTARLIESLGAKAIATTSAGVAWSHGYGDGDHLPVTRLAATVADILRVIRVPLTVDVEGGYSDDPATVADTVARLADAGVAGINLEDGASPPDLLCAKIEHIKRACARAGTNVFINARTDIYLRALAAPGARVEPTLSRAARYRDAGADGLFVPGLADRDEIAAVTAQAGLPLNLLLRPQLPDIDALASLGVRRLSAGSDLAEFGYGQTRHLAETFLRSGRLDAGATTAMDYGALNKLFESR